MTTSHSSGARSQQLIHPATRLGHVHYTVADLDQQVGFYQEVLGFKLHWREADSAGLGAGGEDLLRLTQIDGARQVRGTTGLYHTAFLVPTRRELAQLLRNIAEMQAPIQGTADHGTHLAIYLPDAEGNGIELAWDFPQEQWPETFAEMMRRNRALDPQALLHTLGDNPAPWTGLHAGTRVGHVHLHVSQIAPARQFYHEVLGFDLPFDLSEASGGIADTVIFFAAGDYHHHIGTNIWQGEGAPPPPEDATGLRYFTIILPTEAALERVLKRVAAADIATENTAEGILLHDPASNGVLLTTSPG